MSKHTWFLNSGRFLAVPCLSASLLAAVVLLTAPGAAAEKKAKGNPTLDEALEQQAKVIRELLWKKMNHPKDSIHVGVINFEVQSGDQPSTLKAGPLNWRMARRLEAALILTLDPSEANRFRILHINNPGKNPMQRANHLTEPGRAAFFEKKYPPAWGREGAICADVFLTGKVKVAEKGRTLQVEVKAFDKEDKKLVEVCKFNASTEARVLTEAGVSFVLSRDGVLDPVGIKESIAQLNKEQRNPTEETRSDSRKEESDEKAKTELTALERFKRAPIDFQILYKSEKRNVTEVMEIEDHGPVVWVKEPKEDVEVIFRLKHRRINDKAYGVLLRINGENTIDRENDEPDDFRALKWVVRPGDGFDIVGYQKGQKTAEKFKVLSQAKSSYEMDRYGKDAGLITLAIFEGREEGKQEQVDVQSEVVRAISNGMPDNLNQFSSERLEVLQGNLKGIIAAKQAAGSLVDRGVIVPGPETGSEVEEVPLRTKAKPSSVFQIRYYNPRHRK